MKDILQTAVRKTNTAFCGALIKVIVNVLHQPFFAIFCAMLLLVPGAHALDYEEFEFQLDSRAVKELPPETALAYLRNWQAPAGVELVPKDEYSCGEAELQTIVVREKRSGLNAPYTYKSLRISGIIIPLAGPNPPRRGAFIRLEVTSGRYVGYSCTYLYFLSDAQNTVLAQRMNTEMNRIATALTALGAK